MHVVLIEDDEKIGSFVTRGLKQEGHVVSWSRSGDEGLGLARDAASDLAIVDLMLPGKDGLSIIRALREKKSAIPIIVLSARADVDDRVRGLEAGADDYITKPFSFAELLARVNALRRRASPRVEQPRLEFGDLTLDSDRTEGPALGAVDRSAGQGVHAARVLDAQSGSCALEDDDPAARMGLSLRPPDQCRRCPSEPPPIQDRSRLS